MNGKTQAGMGIGMAVNGKTKAGVGNGRCGNGVGCGNGKPMVWGVGMVNQLRGIVGDSGSPSHLIIHDTNQCQNYATLK